MVARSIPKEYARRYNDEIMSYGLLCTQRSVKHATVLELSAGMEARGSCSLRGCGGANHGVVPCIIVPIGNRPTFHLTRPDLMTSQMLIEYRTAASEALSTSQPHPMLQSRNVNVPASEHLQPHCPPRLYHAPNITATSAHLP